VPGAYARDIISGGTNPTTTIIVPETGLDNVAELLRKVSAIASSFPGLCPLLEHRTG